MKQCKPCITIRDILTILKTNIILFYKMTKRDLSTYRRINASVCTMDNAPQNTWDLVDPEVKKIRNIAREQFQFNDEDRKKIEEAFKKALDNLEKNTK